MSAVLLRFARAAPLSQSRLWQEARHSHDPQSRMAAILESLLLSKAELSEAVLWLKGQHVRIHTVLCFLSNAEASYCHCVEECKSVFFPEIQSANL